VTAAAWVDDEPLAAAEIDARLDRLRCRDRARSLPDPHTREGRQLRRWVAQVAVVERLCEHSADSFVVDGAGIRCGSEHEPGVGEVVTRADAAALGSIVAAAWSNNPAVARAAALVTRDVTVAPERLSRAAALSATDDGGTAWTTDELIASARMEAFARWLARATHERVRLAAGFEHPGDATQPDNLHEH
jgi:[acyl-carrier-protein] S-malonyltransferase